MRPCLLLLFICEGVISFCQADYILYNGKIFTSEKTQIWSEAIAIKGERILAVGKDSEILKLKNMNTRLINLNGRLVTPGFNDAHAHVGIDFPARYFTITGNNVFSSTPWEVLKDSILKITNQVSPGTFIITSISPDLLDDISVRKKILDSLAPDNPVMLAAWTGHGKIMNSRALDFFGINENSEFLGGRIERNENSGLTGLLEEYANYRIAPQLAGKLNTAKIIEELEIFYKKTASLGITTVQNMCSQQFSQQILEIYLGHQFPCRVRLIAFPFTDRTHLLFEEWDHAFHPLNKMNYVSGVKLVLDGTPVERLACLRQPYLDKSSSYGRINFDKETLKEFMEYCLEHEQQIIIHACGDSSIATVINTMRSIHPDLFWRDKRVRIEHADLAVINPTDISTLKGLGIIIVQNPTHLTIPEIMAQRFGNSRMNFVQAMRSLLDSNIHLTLGSDGPVNPFLNMMLATMHPNNPKEAITREEAVIAYTLGAAYAEFKEKEKGTLAKGKLADIVVLSQDIFTVSVDKLPSTHSLLTFIGGRIVYSDNTLR